MIISYRERSLNLCFIIFDGWHVRVGWFYFNFFLPETVQ